MGLGKPTNLKECKPCEWCATYNYREIQPDSSIKITKERYCTHPQVEEVNPNCQLKSEPYEEDGEE